MASTRADPQACPTAMTLLIEDVRLDRPRSSSSPTASTVLKPIRGDLHPVEFIHRGSHRWLRLNRRNLALPRAAVGGELVQPDDGIPQVPVSAPVQLDSVRRLYAVACQNLRLFVPVRMRSSTATAAMKTLARPERPPGPPLQQPTQSDRRLSGLLGAPCSDSSFGCVDLVVSLAADVELVDALKSVVRNQQCPDCAAPGDQVQRGLRALESPRIPRGRFPLRCLVRASRQASTRSRRARRQTEASSGVLGMNSSVIERSVIHRRSEAWIGASSGLLSWAQLTR